MECVDKKELRNRVRRRLKEMDEGTYLSRSALICARLLKEPSIIEGETIAVTISGFPEVETRHIIEAFWKMGKTVAVPKCEPAMRNMTFYAITDFSQLEKVYMGIEEPIAGRTEYVAKERIDVMIVPGVVFNEAGYRIGFGGGYYDRYLRDFRGETLSLAFEEQVVASIPVASHDIPVDIILTDEKRIHARANREEKNK